LAIAILLLLDFAPLHLVAYGQTAGPLPVVTPPPDIFPPPILTAIAGDTPGNCNVLTGPVTAAGGGGASAQCSGGGVLSINAPIGAVGGDGTLAVVTVGAVLGESNDCTGANQLPILATQHFMSVWNRPGQPASINLNLPASINLPIAPSLLAAAGGNPARLLILHSLPDGTVTPILATFTGNGTTAGFQSSQLGDFYAVALPAGLPATYSGRVGQVNLVNHTFVLSGQNGQITVQSTDRQGGTVIVHQNGSPASFNEIPNAPSVQVTGLPSPASCGKTNSVVAKQITLTDVSSLNQQIPQLPSQLPATGLGGMAR